MHEGGTLNEGVVGAEARVVLAPGHHSGGPVAQPPAMPRRRCRGAAFPTAGRGVDAATARRRPLWTVPILVVWVALACTPGCSGARRPGGFAYASANELFHRDPRWLGADGALSVPLSKRRILWLFGDTFVATSPAHLRSQSTMVRNTVAVQEGRDPRTASISFYWRADETGTPAPFFPARDGLWYWPGHGVRLDTGELVVFLYATAAAPGKGLGFANAGYAVAIIDRPEAPPDAWKPRIVAAPPSPFDAVPATAVLLDGAHVVALAIRQQGTHGGALVRYPAASLVRGDVTTAEWWAGDRLGWVPASSLGARGPVFVLDDAGSECSLHWDRRTRRYLHIASYGFGATTIGMRTAPALTGPWSAPIAVCRPPESDGRHPFVYGAKAHPELIGPTAEDLVVTYVANSFELADLLTPAGTRSLYWPRFVAVPVGRYVHAAG